MRHISRPTPNKTKLIFNDFNNYYNLPNDVIKIKKMNQIVFEEMQSDVLVLQWKCTPWIMESACDYDTIIKSGSR